MIKYAIILSAILVTACSATAEPADMTETSSATCNMTLDFSNEPEVAQWRTVLDGVMGGRSSGARFAEDDHMVFQGRIVTQGGGFSSIRRSMKTGDMMGANTLRLRVKSDGRQYGLRFRTSERYRGRTINYEADIPKTAVGEWAEIDVPLTNLKTSFRGYAVPAGPFDASDVREMGIILADGIDGDFRIEIAEITCANP